MSANDFILIKWLKDHYQITRRDLDTNACSEKIGNAKTLEEAVQLTNDWEKYLDWPVEYGIQIIQKPKKRK